CFFTSSAPHRDLPSFPTRRSSDLPATRRTAIAFGSGNGDFPTSRSWDGADRLTLWSSAARLAGLTIAMLLLPHVPGAIAIEEREDRKSTRLNSSHVAISYAVFCLK